MTATDIQSQKEGSFARVSLMDGVWIVDCAKPFTYQLGTAYGVLKLAHKKDQSRVFTLEKANEIRENMVRLYPTTRLEPATFEQWVEQRAGVIRNSSQ